MLVHDNRIQPGLLEKVTVFTFMLVLYSAGCSSTAKVPEDAQDGHGLETVADVGDGDSTDPGGDVDAQPTDIESEQVDDVCPPAPLNRSGGVVALFHHDPSPVYPIPSDQFTRADAATSTGLRLSVQVDDNLLTNESMGLLMPAVKMAGLLSRQDGWSVHGPILVPFSGALDATSLGPCDSNPHDPATSVFLVRIDKTGTCSQRVGLAVELAGGQGDQSSLTILAARPLQKLEESTRYALVVTRALLGANSLPVDPDEQFELPEELRCLTTGNEPICPNNIAVATVFTTSAPTQALVELNGWLTENWAPNLDLTVDEVFDPSTRAIWPSTVTAFPASSLAITGSFAAPDLRDDDRDFSLVAGEMPESHGSFRVPFVMLLPSETVPKPWPVAVMGHGMNGNKERIAYLAERFGEKGFVLVAIDAPGHGALEHLGSLNTYEVPLLRGGYRQGHVNLLTLLLALGQLNSDLLPLASPDGVKELAMDQGITYVGESMGGIMGLPVCLVSPQVRGMSMSVTGGHLSAFILTYVGAMMPPNKRFVTLALEALAQPMLDVIDPLSFAGLVAGPEAPPSVLLQAALGDSTVPNPGTNELARGLGLTQVCPCPTEVQGIPRIEAPALVNGLAYFDDVSHGFFLANASNPEATDSARRQAAHFLSTSLTGQGEVISH